MEKERPLSKQKDEPDKTDRKLYMDFLDVNFAKQNFHYQTAFILFNTRITLVKSEKQKKGSDHVNWFVF